MIELLGLIVVDCMKKCYDRKNTVICGTFVFLFFIILFILLLLNKRMILYDKFSGVVEKDDLLVFLLSDEELELFYKNKELFLNNLKEEFNIRKVDKAVLEREGVFYNRVLIEIDIDNMYKVNESLDISIARRSVKCVKMFKVIWDGDLNE